jgi:malate dehydrogenase (oxaloacetate-decarboxylating)
VLACDPNVDAAKRGSAAGARVVRIDELLADAQIVIAATGRAGLITAGQIRRGQIVFALSNPDPEIDPKAAIAAGAALASDGRAINNALAFPGLMRGVIDARAGSISAEMMIRAARAIAAHAPAGELVPSPLDRTLHGEIASTVARCARETGLADTAKP